MYSEKELCGISPNFHTHVSVSDLYIPFLGIFVLNFRYCVFAVCTTKCIGGGIHLFCVPYPNEQHCARTVIGVFFHCEISIPL
jgi:hypothetical protein